jgi:hypothetical protein
MELAEVIYTFMQNPPRWPENEIIGHIAALIRYRDFDEAGEPVFLHAAAAWRPAVSRQNGEA